jgi:SAICAR synthetase
MHSARIVVSLPVSSLLALDDGLIQTCRLMFGSSFTTSGNSLNHHEKVRSVDPSPIKIIIMPSSANCLHVFLLLDPSRIDEARRSSLLNDLRALGVDSTANCQVHVRSTNVPQDRFHQRTNESQQPEQALVVVWACKTSSTALYLKEHSSCPVIFLDDDDDKSTNDHNGAVAPALVIAKFVSLYSPTIVGAKVRRRVEAMRQAALVEDSKLMVESYVATIAECYDTSRQITGDAIIMLGDEAEGLYQRFRGKVRDRWESSASPHICAMVTTDRQSGFDRQLAIVPYKGSVLNLCSQFWFRETADIIPNHLLDVPHPAVAICRRCQPFPIEFVVRYVYSVGEGPPFCDDSFVTNPPKLTRSRPFFLLLAART